MIWKITLGALALAVGAAVFQTWRLEALQARQIEGRVELRACGARLNNLIEKVKSDAEIDAIGDLTRVPPHWLLPPGNPGE